MAVVAALVLVSAASGQTTTGLEAPAEGGGVLLNVQSSGTGPLYWRVERSSDLVDWTRADALVTQDGYGTQVLATAGPGGDEGFLYRVVADSSAVNVLEPDLFSRLYHTNPLPAHLLTPAVAATDNTPAFNPVTDAGAALGRVLFYDKNLSLNYAVSCASCHRQENGFSDPDALSSGFAGGHTDRNSMGLANARYYARGRFFWDERAATLEDQVLQPIQNTVEMSMTLTGLVARLENFDYYRELFTATYGDPAITTGRIARALAQFVRSMVSYQSKYDIGFDTAFANFTTQENQGMQIFNGPRGNCVACHAGPNFVGNRIENNGLEFPFVDLGAGAVTGQAADEGKFKMSSLRNIEVTAPYMHDGRFATLEEVIDHYSTGVVQNVNLGPALMQPGPPGQPPVVRRPNFTEQERAALVAFLKTLTDPVFLADPKFADPF